MAGTWPWIAVAGLGALHALSPATGWMFAAAWGVRARDTAQVRRALLPIAVGHAVSVAVVAYAVAQGMALDRTLVQRAAGALLMAAAAWRMRRGARPYTAIGMRAGNAGMAFWAFLMATAHGAGLMLVPALVPLCLADNPAREITASGSWFLALGAIGVHTAAMLVTTGAIATGVCRGIALHPRLQRGSVLQGVWTAALAITGMLLLMH